MNVVVLNGASKGQSALRRNNGEQHSSAQRNVLFMKHKNIKTHYQHKIGQPKAESIAELGIQVRVPQLMSIRSIMEPSPLKKGGYLHLESAPVLETADCVAL
jgi:hypothetical protein